MQERELSAQLTLMPESIYEVFGEKLTSRHFELPREYRQRLENEGTAVVVTTGSGKWLVPVPFNTLL
eukprot:g27209.t1